MTTRAWGQRNGAGSKGRVFDDNERAKVIVGIESTLEMADSYCLQKKELIVRMMQNPELRHLMFNVAAVDSIIDGLVAEGKLESNAYARLGILALTQEYFSQFREPEKRRNLGENARSIAPTAKPYPS